MAKIKLLFASFLMITLTSCAAVESYAESDPPGDLTSLEINRDQLVEQADGTVISKQ